MRIAARTTVPPFPLAAAGAGPVDAVGVPDPEAGADGFPFCARAPGAVQVKSKSNVEAPYVVVHRMQLLHGNQRFVVRREEE